MSEEGHYVLAFAAPHGVQELYGQARARCVRQLNHCMESDALGLRIRVSPQFLLTTLDERRLGLQLDRMIRNRELTAPRVTIGSVGRFREPEDVVYLEVGGDDVVRASSVLTAALVTLGRCDEPTKAEPLYIGLGRRTASSKQSEELQDLAFGVCSDLTCECRIDLREPSFIHELVLFDCDRGEAVRTWTLSRQ